MSLKGTLCALVCLFALSFAACEKEDPFDDAHTRTRLKLNDLIRGHRFNPISTLVLLSRVSAGYIHMMEKAGYDEKCQEGSVEERFFFMVQAQLAELDLDETKKYIERVNENIS